MPTNEERREVARGLRNLAGTYVTLGELESVLGVDITSSHVDIERDAKSLNSLADLIEPEPERTCKREKLYDAGGEWYVGCSKCRNPLALYDVFCSKCGAKVVEDAD